MSAKYIFVTAVWLSSLGKGLRGVDWLLLESRGLKST